MYLFLLYFQWSPPSKQHKFDRYKSPRCFEVEKEQKFAITPKSIRPNFEKWNKGTRRSFSHPDRNNNPQI